MYEVGRRVQRFTIVAHLGTGGSGTVVRARDPQLERDVAIKLLTHGRASIPELVAKQTIDLRTEAPAGSDDLLREARMMARLSHPNLLPVYEVGLDGDTVFVVMEHIDGADLRTWSRGRSKRELVEVLRQAARGLVAAHEQDIVHGDFKPENVLVGRDRRVRVADFGLARLGRPSPAMRRLDSVGGTPRYMAPELWVGERASKASDVYAFCMTARELLGERPGGALQHALIGGTADDPRRRPPIATVLAALERPGSRRWWFAAAAAATVLAGGGAAFALTRSAEVCTIDRSVPGTWGPARRFALGVALTPAKVREVDRIRIAQIAKNFDESQRDIDERIIATCKAQRSGSLTRAQAEIKKSCLERRVIELAVKVDHFIAHPRADGLGAMVERARIPERRDCDDISVPALPADRAPVIALYRRLIDSEIVPTAQRAIVALDIGKEAKALGERELETRTQLLSGMWHDDSGKLTEADALFERAYQMAVEIRAAQWQAMALISRARNANKRGDAQTALSLGKLALSFADSPAASPGVRAKIYSDLGRAAAEGSDPRTAMDLYDKALDTIAKDGHRLPFIEAGVRLERVRAFGSFEGKKQEGLAAARENVTWVADTFGERSPQAANALEQVSSFQRWAGDPAGALETQERAYKLRQETSPGDPALALTKGNLAQLYEFNGRFEEARTMYAEELAEADHNELVKAYVPLLYVRLGVNTCAVGRCDEGYPLIERGLELGISQYGADHMFVTGYRSDLLSVQVELGKLAAAEKTIEAMRRSYDKDPKRSARSLVMLRAVEARIAIERGSPQQAEQLAREALAAWDELKGDADPRGGIVGVLASALIAQRKLDDARPLVEQLVANAKVEHASADSLAVLEILRAEIEAGTGQLADAKQRAKRAREALLPMSMIARRRADAVLAR